MTVPFECDWNAGAAPVSEFFRSDIPGLEPRTEHWYAAHTCSRYEKCVAKQLEERALGCTLQGACRRERGRERGGLLRRHRREALVPRLFLRGLRRDRADHANPGNWRDAVGAHLEAPNVEGVFPREPDVDVLRRHVI